MAEYSHIFTLINVITVILIILLSGLVGFLIHYLRIRAQQHEALRKLSEIRQHFFTNITHEFRTPLTVILGLSHEIIDDNQVNKGVKEKARTIERQGFSLLTLINQLLDISRIKSSVGNADWRNGNISAHVEMIVETYREYARSRNINLQYVSDGPIIMDFVPDYATKVFNNLIHNALKFTPEYGKVTLKTSRRNDQLIITVSDTGCGISNDDLKHIYEPFFQAETDARYLGTGIGLALVKQIIDAVDGNIKVDSIVGKGSTFHLSIPIHNNCKLPYENNTNNVNPLLPQPEKPLTDSEYEDRQRVLIIEDNSDVADYIGSFFTDRYSVYYAQNGNIGLEKAWNLVPDLIITDLMMPGTNGLEVCRQIKENDVTCHIPIIIITAKITDEDRLKGIEAGADAFLTKPFIGDELRKRVEQLLKSRRILHEKYSINTNDSQHDEISQDPSERRFLSRVTDAVYILLNQHKEADVASVAGILCMSTSQFYRKMMATNNQTPSAFIQRIKIKRACHLMDSHADLALSDVAEQCGFNDYSSFVRAFRHIHNITPTDYRRRG